MEHNMEPQKELVKRKIRQLVFLHAQYVGDCKISVNQTHEYNRIYADWQAGLVTFEEIQEDLTEYKSLMGK